VKKGKKLPERLVKASIKKLERDIEMTEFQIATLEEDFEDVRDPSLKRVINNWLERKREKLDYLKKSLKSLKQLKR